MHMKHEPHPPSRFKANISAWNSPHVAYCCRTLAFRACAVVEVHARSFMRTAIIPPTQRGRCRPSLTSRPLQFRVGMKTTILLFFSSFTRISTSFKVSIGHHRDGRQLSTDARHAYAAIRESSERSVPRRLTWRASSNELSQVTVDVKRSGRNPVDTAQVLLPVKPDRRKAL